MLAVRSFCMHASLTCTKGKHECFQRLREFYNPKRTFARQVPVVSEQLRTLVNSFMIHINLAIYVLFMIFFGISQISLQCNILLSHLLKFLLLRPSLSVRYDCISKVFPKAIRGCHYIIVLIESPEWKSISTTRQESYCSPAGATYYIVRKNILWDFSQKEHN